MNAGVRRLIKEGREKEWQATGEAQESQEAPPPGSRLIRCLPATIGTYPPYVPDNVPLTLRPFRCTTSSILGAFERDRTQRSKSRIDRSCQQKKYSPWSNSTVGQLSFSVR
jgi:hypothetical protein